MQNWYIVWRIKSVFSKLALPLGVWQRNVFTKLERRLKQRNSPFKKKNFTVYKSSYFIFKFKIRHGEWRSVSNFKLVLYVFKGNAQFILSCNPPKSGASRVWITFLQITPKILTKDIFNWLELIIEIQSFLQIFIVRKTTTQLFWYFRISPKKNSKKISTKKTIFMAYFCAFKSKLQIFDVATYITLFLHDCNNCFIICLVPYIPICRYYFLIFCFYFLLLFPSVLATRHILQFAMFDLISL